MNLTVKTLKGGKFTVEVDPSHTVAQVKGVIEQSNSELPAASMKLIHSGKVLKDEDVIESCNIKPNDFLVVMIAKAKKAPVEAPAAAAPAPAATTAETSVNATPAASTTTTTPGAPLASTTAPAAAASTPAATATSSEAAVSSPTEFPAEVINNLKALGFPETEVMACLRASNGNPDVAVEFLMNGIPPGIDGGGGGTAGGNATSGGAASGGSLDALRNHPQFNDLRRLVQTNPSTLQTVLAQIGQQQPELLRAINANQAEFLQMMNEPVTEASGGSGGAAPSGSSNNATGASSGVGGANPFAMDPTQLGTMLSSMPPAEQAAMAQMMGMSIEQLQQTAQMISAMPQEQVQQYMNMAMAAQGMDMGGLAEMMGGGAVGGGGAQVLRLSEEEMAAVDRLTEMGFDRAEAAQAYLACDKNEALAANLLMDGGFGGFGGDMGDGGADAGEGDDDMYD